MRKPFKQILTSKVNQAAIETPLEESVFLSQLLNNRVLLKREDLQPVFSFKIRGAYNRIAHLSEAERAKGIITASAGNHAQGVAFSGQKLAIDTTIVMPVTTPAIKVAAVKSFGAKVVLYCDSYSEAADQCALGRFVRRREHLDLTFDRLHHDCCIADLQRQILVQLPEGPQRLVRRVDIGVPDDQ